MNYVPDDKRGGDDMLSRKAVVSSAVLWRHQRMVEVGKKSCVMVVKYHSRHVLVMCVVFCCVNDVFMMRPGMIIAPLVVCTILLCCDDVHHSFLIEHHACTLVHVHVNTY